MTEKSHTVTGCAQCTVLSGVWSEALLASSCKFFFCCSSLCTKCSSGWTALSQTHVHGESLWGATGIWQGSGLVSTLFNIFVNYLEKSFWVTAASFPGSTKSGRMWDKKVVDTLQKNALNCFACLSRGPKINKWTCLRKRNVPVGEDFVKQSRDGPLD